MKAKAQTARDKTIMLLEDTQHDLLVALRHEPAHDLKQTIRLIFSNRIAAVKSGRPLRDIHGRPIDLDKFAS